MASSDSICDGEMKMMFAKGRDLNERGVKVQGEDKGKEIVRSTFFGLHEERVLVPQDLLSALAGSATNLSPYGRQDR